ncbi:hypothetical protein NDA15_006396 [Ustilago hordei]|nr:hypothetical protein NDA15_006396 [Ustilago hordei]
MGSMGIPTARVTTTLRGGIGGLPGSMCPGRIPGGGGEGRRDGALAASPSSAQATSSDEGKVDDEGKQDS